MLDVFRSTGGVIEFAVSTFLVEQHAQGFDDFRVFVDAELEGRRRGSRRGIDDMRDRALGLVLAG
ncbi:hypothetical protein D3C75_1142140 [compost metagenome]